MMKIKEKSLQMALNAASCRELPRATLDEGADSYWIKAIALVRKRDTTCSYCLVERHSDGLIRYTRDFGTLSPIYGLVSVHPYESLDLKRFGFSGDDKAFRVYVRGRLRLSDEELSKFSDDDFRRLRIEYAYEKQRESDVRYQLTGVAETLLDEEAEAAAHAPAPIPVTSTVLKAEDGSLEEFTDISSAKVAATPRRGRPKGVQGSPQKKDKKR